MPRFTSLAALSAIAITGCSTRVSHEESQPFGSSTTIVEVAPLDSRSPTPIKPPPDPQPPFVGQVSTGNVIVFGDVEEHRHHLHIHEAPMPPNLRVDVRVESRWH